MRKIRNNIQEEKGITLIALVVTIIVLIILAGISIQLLLGQNGIITKSKQAKLSTDKASAKEKVVLAVGGSYGENGEIEIAALKNNLRTIEGANGIDSITNLPAKIEVDGYNLIIEKNGNVIFEEEYEKPSIYARLYKKNGTDEEVLIFASKESAFQDYSSELTLSSNIGNIYAQKGYTEEDLYEIPGYAEMLNSEEWKQIKEEDPEYAQEMISEILEEMNTYLFTPWLKVRTVTVGSGTMDEHYNDAIAEVRIIDEIYPSSTNNWFENCENLQKIVGIENLNTSNVTDMGEMFEGCSNLSTIDLSSLNTSNVTIMYSMFKGCTNLTKLDLRNFDTSNVRNMVSMFSGCIGLKALILGNFNTSNVTDMTSMFNGCSSLTIIDLSELNTSNVTSMHTMFENCTNLTKLDLRNFDTTKVTNMRYMFSNCKNLSEILVGKGWKNASDSRYMFSNCGVSEVTYVTE